MAKVMTVGGAAVLVSEAKLEDLKLIKKLRPSALILKGGEDNKDEIFRVGFGKGNGSINSVGVEFDEKSFNEDGYATVTMMVDPGVAPGNVKDWVADKIGVAILHLNALEQTFPVVLAEIAEEKAEILESIEVL